MNNAEKFKEIFKKFATEVWAFPEKDFLTWLNAEYKEPTTKNNLGVDCISRADVHDMLENLPITVEDKWFNWLQKACMRLAELPSVTPQPCEDAISRKEVLNQIFYSTDNSGDVVLGSELRSRIERLPSVTTQLPIPEVTALAEWTEKLTKECEEAYNKGYADGVKSVNICPHCGEYIGEEE